MSAANERQIGGAHYQKGTGKQHWDIVDEYGVPYLEGVASKYPLRWREKGGVEDLEKTLHYIDKILERPDSDARWSRRPQLPEQAVAVRELISSHGYSAGDTEWLVVEQILCGGNRPAYVFIRRELSQYICRIREQSGPGTPEDGGQHARQPEETTEAVLGTLTLPSGSRGSIKIVGSLAEVRWEPAT